MIFLLTNADTELLSIRSVLHRLPADTNEMDWRSGVRRAFAGADAGVRYTLCYGAAAAAALFAASWLGISDPYWATLCVLPSAGIPVPMSRNCRTPASAAR